MNNLNNQKFDCTGCFACEFVCPTKAITMEKTSEGFFEYNIDSKKCINCGLCVLKCPKLNKIKKISYNQKCYAAFSNNEEILENSSSGGIFSEIALEFLKNKGVVIGAAWVDGIVKHIAVYKKDELPKLRSSKYIQSDLSDVYYIIKKELTNKKKVLFSGTPCQVSAVNLMFKDENLFTIDVVCHGVANKKVLDLSLEQRFKRTDLIVDFRNKISGWHYSFSIKYFKPGESTLVHINKNSHDSWFRKYLKNEFLKKDCYDCNFTGKNKSSNLTLGDFWNIININAPFYKMNNNRGVSLVVINNNKGERMFNNIKETVTYSKEKLELATKYNPRLLIGKYSSNHLKKRKVFFKKMANQKILFKDRSKYFYMISDKCKSVYMRIIGKLVRQK